MFVGCCNALRAIGYSEAERAWLNILHGVSVPTVNIGDQAAVIIGSVVSANGRW
jgi:hypothetical protein